MSFYIKKVTDKDEITQITLDIMNALPKWFSPPEDIIRKSKIHRDFDFWAAYNSDTHEPIGFITYKIHNKYTAEIYDLGILKEHQGNGIGTALFDISEKYFVENKFSFITVKTLDESADYPPYEGTRRFYLKCGFLPLEVFTEYWDKDNPCLFLGKYIRK